jgi:hypothetical protein
VAALEIELGTSKSAARISDHETTEAVILRCNISNKGNEICLQFTVLAIL